MRNTFEVDAVTKELFITAPHVHGGKKRLFHHDNRFGPIRAFRHDHCAISPIGGTYNPVVMGPREITYPENGTWRWLISRARYMVGN